MKAMQRIGIIVLIHLFLAGCASLPDEIEHPVEQPSQIQDSSLVSIVNSLDLQDATGLSAVLLQESGWDALAQRLSLIEQAEHEIDIQYYIWNSDSSGRYLASRLFAAADRGVRVRVLLDDINLNEREALLASLDQHPKIEIRIYNPTPNRRGLSRWFSFLTDFSRLNRRMHNKSFTVDGAFSVVGGRNIGDEYFDLSNEINFRDRDALVAGAVVSEIQNSFVKYWNSSWSYPVELLSTEGSADLPDPATLSAPVYKHQAKLPEGKLVAREYLQSLKDQMTRVQARYISDPPVPVDSQDSSKPKATAQFLDELLSGAKQEIVLESAYLILDDRQLSQLQAVADRGVEIKALTNSMASNDLLTNHSGYAGRRKSMIESGMQLFELKPDASLCLETLRDKAHCAPQASYGLHSKSVVYDREISIVGSFNLNLRSTYLNTESILVIENKDFSEALAITIEYAMHDTNSWQLRLKDKKLQWFSGNDVWTTEPETGRWERTKSRFYQLFPIEKYL